MVTFYAERAPMAAALQAGSIDAMDQFSVATSPQLLNGSYNVISLKAATHGELSMRCDDHPFTNKLVRQAIALTLDRPGIVQALFKGQASDRERQPVRPGLPQVQQPQRPPAQAGPGQGQAAARQGRRSERFLDAASDRDDPGDAPLRDRSSSSAARRSASTSASRSRRPTKYYGCGVFGKSDWLDGEMSLVDYGARAVPNLYLEAPLQTINTKTGHGRLERRPLQQLQYDKLSKQFIAAVDLSSQRKLAGQIETLLLDETPIIFAYFYNYLTRDAKERHGRLPDGAGRSSSSGTPRRA